MARSQNLSDLSIKALTKLREDIDEALSRRADGIREQLLAIGTDHAEIAAYGRKGRSALKGRKVPVKYRDKSGNTWTGRVAQPRWLTAAIKSGAKRDDFLVGRPPPKKKVRKKVSRKAARRKK